MKSRLIFAPVLALLISAVSLGQTAPPRLTQLPKNPPSGMLSAIPLGAKSGTDLLHLAISLKPRDPVGLQQFADSVSDPKSANYRNFISPDEVGRRFGMTSREVQSVSNYLAAQGMTLHLIGKNRLTILADCSVDQAESAFHTSIQTFSTLTPGNKSREIRFSFTTPPVLPVDIAGKIDNIAGLEDFTRPQKRTPLEPGQFRTAYAVAPMYNAGTQGQNRTVAISSFDGFQVSNVASEISTFGLPSPPAGPTKNITVKTISGGSGSGQATGEGDLDMQTVIAMAPLCNLIIYDGGNNDIISVLTQEANENIADIITESYGWNLDTGTALSAHNLHLSMSAQGITYLAAAGDSGTDFQGFTYPDTDPEVLLVGGTSLTLNSNGTRNTEVGWNSGGGSGGGGWNITSDTFNVRPSYQVGTGVPSASQVPYRLVPDVSFNADPNTGYLIFATLLNNGQEQFAEWVVGGTSGASPTCAGALAVAEQQLIAYGALKSDSNGNYRYGRINDLLYSYNGDSSIFYDITSGTNGTLPNGATSIATKGWDTDSGWGPIIFAGLVARLDNVVSIKSVSVNPTTIEGGSSSTVTGTVSLAAPAPSGGVSLGVTSSDPSTTVPATVTIAAGSTTGQFKITTTGVSQSTTVTITASVGASSASGNLTVTSHHPTTFSLSPTSVVGGSPSGVIGTVSLDKPAPSNGVVVSLTSGNPSAATVPDTITVASGKSSASFAVTTFGVAAKTSVVIGVSAGGLSKTATLTLNPVSLSSVGLSSTSASAGTLITGTVSLNGLAPSVGAKVALTISNSSLASLSTSSVLVASGNSNGAFTLTTKGVSVATTLTVTARLGTVTKTTTLKLLPPAITGISISTSSALGGVGNPTVTVTLNSPAGSSGAKVTLSTSPSSAAKFTPATLTIASGKTSGSTTLKTIAVSQDTSVTVTGTLNGAKSVTLLVQAAVLSDLSLSKTAIKGGSGSVTGTVTLNGPAGPGSHVVTLSSSNPSAASVKATVSIAAGKSTATFTISTKAVAVSTSATITAALGANRETATLTVTH